MGIMCLIHVFVSINLNVGSHKKKKTRMCQLENVELLINLNANLDIGSELKSVLDQHFRFFCRKGPKRFKSGLQLQKIPKILHKLGCNHGRCLMPSPYMVNFV